MQPLLVFSHVDLYYERVHALKDVSLEMSAGEAVALVGANGAGKSSILRAITGLQKIRRGEIHFEGRRIDGLSLMGAFTRKDAAGVRASMDLVLTRFPRLKERFHQNAGTMSGGEQQMLAIGRALMSKPKLLMLDEPSLGVAPLVVQEIARSIISIRRDENVSILLVEQNSRMALRVSDRAYALTTGTVALSGASESLAKDPRIQQLYLGGEP